MKQLFLLFLAIGFTRAYSQNYFPTSGSVGIGTLTPQSSLDIFGTDIRLRNQNLAMGAYSSLMLQGGSEYNYGLEIDFFGNPNLPDENFSYNVGFGGAAIVNVNAKPLALGTNNLPRLFITGNGNVLIGRTSQSNTSYLFDVNGKMRANEIVVNTNGADFVFDKRYRLMPLSRLESYIKTNKHLPEIASAAEMKKKGIGLSEMNAKLLQKVEELTLHLIQQEKLLNQQSRRIRNLEKKKK